MGPPKHFVAVFCAQRLGQRQGCETAAVAAAEHSSRCCVWQLLALASLTLYSCAQRRGQQPAVSSCSRPVGLCGGERKWRDSLGLRRAFSGGLADQDRIFQNIYGEHDTSIKGAMKIGDYHQTDKIVQKARAHTSLAPTALQPLSVAAVPTQSVLSPALRSPTFLRAAPRWDAAGAWEGSC
eukprot:513638-Rhodomonas_salina.1